MPAHFRPLLLAAAFTAVACAVPCVLTGCGGVESGVVEQEEFDQEAQDAADAAEMELMGEDM